MLKFRTVLIIVLLIGLTVFSSACKESIEILGVQDITHKSEYTPEAGIDYRQALSATSEYLQNERSVGGDFSNEIDFRELTTEELWENSRLQIFRVTIRYAWLDGVVIFEDGHLIEMLWGQDIISILASDLDSDGFYEICMNSNFGSGFVRSMIIVYDVKTKAEYQLQINDDIWDVLIYPNNEKHSIDVYTKDMRESTEFEDYFGELRLNKNHLEIIQ